MPATSGFTAGAGASGFGAAVPKPASTPAAPAPLATTNASSVSSAVPQSILGGWTASSLLPSSSVVAAILGSSTGTTQAPTVAPGSTPGPVAGTPSSGFVSQPGMKVPSGWGGGGNDSGNTAFGGGRGGIVDPSLNPQQAYAAYLQNRGFGDTSTPLEAAMNQAVRANQTAGVADPFGFGANPATQPVGGIGNMASNGANQAALQAALASRVVGKASPYAYTYGSPAANAPGAQPQGGYTSGWGPGTGFGFG